VNPARTTLVDVIAAHARYAPGSLAVIDGTGETTYGELWAAAGRVAGGLRRLGVQPGDRVVIAATPAAAYLGLLFGIMAAGAVAVPLNTRLTPDEAGAYLSGLTPRLLVHDAAHAALAAGLDVPAVRLTDLPAAGAGIALDPAAPAAIFGTGGTTGLPKGAVWSHQGLWLYAASCQANLETRRTDVELYFSPFFHIAVVTALLSTMYAGGCAWVLPRFDEAPALDALRTGRPTRMFGAPTALARLIRHPLFDPSAMRSVRRVLFGSTRSEPGFVAEASAAFPAARLVTGYGATEFGAVARLRSWETDDGTDRGVGRPVPGAGIRVVGPGGEELPRGAVGELIVAAPWQMLGYWGAPPGDPASFLDGGIRSGDLGRLDGDGFLHLTGRAKDVIITGGENVFPVEVEDVLGGYPGVLQSAVFGRLDPTWGERVEAAIVCGTAVDVAELRAYCRTRLAGYKVPRHFHVVPELPLTAASKVDKRRLSEVLSGD
jgi:fatty-acyl-CoA synthase